MHFLTSIVPAAIVLGVLIIIHEFGHFIACRLSRVKVEKFSIGFGPEIFHWKGKETHYAISLFPLGGFVKPAGESLSELEGAVPKPGDYLAAALGSRIFIVVSGVVMNYLLAYVLFVLIFVLGRPLPGTVIGSFVDNYPAKTSGLQTGDKIIRVNETSVKTWKELLDALETAPGQELQLIVERRNARLPIAISPKVEEAKDIFGEKIKTKRIGIVPSPEAVEFERYGFPRALKEAWDTEFYLTTMTHKAIFYLIIGKLSVRHISGPIGIISMTGSAAQLGLIYVLQLTATLSVSLAVINLLPIPALDGGHLFFLLIEGLRRKQVSLKVQERATQVGFALLLTLMAFIVYNDLMNMHVVEKIRKLFGF